MKGENFSTFFSANSGFSGFHVPVKKTFKLVPNKRENKN